LDQNTYDKGREVRAAVLGEAYVNAATADADDFNKPFQDLVTEYCWGALTNGVTRVRIARQTFAELDEG
jgi:4-carboxymuconolactone decarboxylase